MPRIRETQGMALVRNGAHLFQRRLAGQHLLDAVLAQRAHAFGQGLALKRRWTQRNAVDGRLVMHSSHGCEKCDHTGFKGRAGIHEMMVISRELRRMIQNGSRAEALQRTAMKEGMRTLRQDGIEKVLAGQTTIEEVRASSNV